MGSSSGSKRRRGADDAASSERNKTLHSSFATAANAVAGLYSAASAAQKSASAAGARAVFVAVRDPSRRAVVRFRSLSLFCFLFLSFKREN